MLIAIDASRANTEQKTGVENYAFQVIENLKEIIPENFQVVLYSREPLVGEIGKLPKNWRSNVLVWKPRHLWTQLRLSWQIILDRPDILFIPAHVFPFIHPKKTVMTVHDVAAAVYPESYNWFERWYSIYSAKKALKKFPKIITPSEYTADELLRLFKKSRGLEKKISVIHHGFDKKYSQIADKDKISEIYNKYRITGKYIICIGRLETKKNTCGIIGTYNILRKNYHENIQLLLVGKPGFGYEKVKKALEKSPYNQDILMPSWVGADDLCVLVQNAFVTFFPSFYEGFGLPVLESMAAGTPVITSQLPSLKEVGGRAALYVDPKNEQAMAEEIESLLSNESLYDERVRLGFEQIKKFSWEKCGQETWRVLFGLLKGL